MRVEQARILGFSPPGDETFAEVAARYLQYQKARLTPKAYEREQSIVDGRLKPLSMPCAPEVSIANKIFGGITPGQVTVAFRRVCKGLKIVDFRFHDLRHTAASWLRMSGADIHTVAQLLGHKDLRMAARYQHLSPAFLADDVCKLDVVFGDFSGGSEKPIVSTPKALVAALN